MMSTAGGTGPNSTTRHQVLRKREGGSKVAFYSLGVAAAILVWYAITLSSESPLYAFGPGGTLAALQPLVASPRFWQGLAETLKRLSGGLAVAAAAGVPLGLLTGYFARGHQLTYVPFQILRMISPLAWTPVAIIVFGIGSGPVYFLVAIAAVWPIILNTAAGVRAADPQWLDAARCLGAGDKELLQFVLVRAALPQVLVGLQLALGVGWIVIVPAEMLGVASGLGYMILDFRDVSDYASVMALIMVIGVLGLAIDLPFRTAVRWASWHDRPSG